MLTFYRFLFLQFNSASDAKAALSLDGYKMDKVHVLSVFPFDDVETFQNFPDEYQEPLIEEFKPKEHLKSWLSDSRARDQFSLVKGDEVGIYWNNKADLPDKVQERSVRHSFIYLILIM